MIRMILFSFCLLFSSLSIVIPGEAHSNEMNNDAIASFRKDYPTVSVASVEKTDIEGLYEVIAGGNIFYYHQKSGNILFGEMITKNFKNIHH